MGLPCPPLQHLRQPAPAARDDLIALWCRLRDAQPTQPSSRAELQQARLALGLRRAQRGQSSASQLATNPRQRLWCHLARGQGPRHRKQGPSSGFWVPIEEAKRFRLPSAPSHRRGPTGLHRTQFRNPNRKGRKREKREKDRRPNAFFRARQGCHSKSYAQFLSFG